MVHRLPDSRLLSNLIAYEKEYTKHLSALFPISHAALASLSAFAAASPSAKPFSNSSVSLAQTIGAIVDILAGADDALQLYNQAVENWRDQLGHLIQLEEDIAAILRDREILVTRLIKVSKSSKAARDPRSSLILPSGSTSFTSLPSTNSTTHGSSSTKLLQAQEELRACEAHLATKELELEVLRISIAREGLGARCRALVDCGWAWGEMGKEGLRALQSLGASNPDSQVLEQSLASHSHSHSPSASITLPQQKPLPPPALPPHLIQGPLSYSSDISSLTPSQSASQLHDGPSRETSQEGALPDHPSRNGHEEVTIAIPPAHAISELTMPTGVRSPSPLSVPLPESSTDLHTSASESRPLPRRTSTQQKRRPLSRRITEVDENEHREGPAVVENPYFPSLNHVRSADDSSEEEETQGPLEVVENNPFGQSKRLSLRHKAAPETTEHIPERDAKQRGRKSSMSFFGSLRGLFKTSHKDQTRAEWDDTTESPRTSKHNKGKKAWSTRTDANLKASKSQDSLDSEPNVVPKPSPSSGGAKLRKGRSPTTAPASFSGWQSDGPPSISPRASVRRKKKKSVAELKGKNGGHTDGELDASNSGFPSRTQSEVVTQRPSAKRQITPTSSPQAQPLSRASSNSTRNSTTPAPSSSNQTPAKSRHRRVTTDLSGKFDSSNGEASNGGSPRRSASLTYGAAPGDYSAAAKSKSKRTPTAGTVHPSPAKGSTSVSLMSIVEDVARQNRNTGGTTSSPPSTTKLEVPRAPIPGVPVNVSRSSKLSDDRYPVPRSGSLDIPRAPGSVFSASQSLPVISGTQGTTGHKYETPLNSPSTKGNGSASASRSKASRPAVSPLRSALRNSSRTPSPSPAQLAEIQIRKRGADVRAEEDDKPRGRTPEREDPGERTPRPARPEQATQPNGVLIRDSISMTSISSYDTAQESPVEGEPAPEPQVPPAPQHDTESTASTETPLARRKSVRVSLQPTFSSTPPALDDDEAHARYPWSSTKKDSDNQEAPSEPGVWQDSSDEDEEYSRARKLLSRVGKKDKGKKKKV
ncbi:uncharacterized protein EDB91DRAFT_1212236 [Suillus paluster]|uniref:uncharacterized protein n=1 Tax=Suillus paluster TaxID=48578 RepID=UPI001B86124B|nr:uncharacterized protein EDB91DRAFT_1212236 [Suillus paluster]KAG1717720.1 hypothetical protein EDB91DRAFT_1212236 [Suillus paluster]